jgi:SAM-dependent methyltransferase
VVTLKARAATYSTTLDRGGRLHDATLRERKAAKIIAILDAEGALRSDCSRVLDIGCSHGHILRCVAGRAAYGIGVDVDRLADVQRADNIAYLRADAEALPFSSRSFDVIICNHVYEHTDTPERLVAEIRRLLKPEGLCYFAGPNRYAVMEPHVHLPFVSWLPAAVADTYVRALRKGDGYHARPYSHRRLLDLISDFDISDYTGRILDDPRRFVADDLLPPGSLKLAVARIVYRHLRGLFPTFVFILRPRPDGSSV